MLQHLLIGIAIYLTFVSFIFVLVNKILDEKTNEEMFDSHVDDALDIIKLD